MLPGQNQIADILGKARTTVANILRLNSLSQPVRSYLRSGKLDMGHARALISLAAPQQIKLAEKIIAQQMNVRQAERLAQKLLTEPEAQAMQQVHIQHQDTLHALADQLTKHLHTPVRIKPLKGNKGQLSIHYDSLDHLRQIVNKF